MIKWQLHILATLFIISLQPIFGQYLLAYNHQSFFPSSGMESRSFYDAPQDTSFNTVAVLGFATEGLTQLEAQVLTDRFTMELEETNAIQAIVSRNTVEEILIERDIPNNNCLTDSCMVEIGNILGVDFLIRGHILNDNGWYTLNIDLFSVGKEWPIEERKVHYNGEPNGLIVEVEMLAWNIVNKPSPLILYKEKEEKALEAAKIIADRKEAARIASEKRLKNAKLGALWRSTILPGWGQLYSGRKTSGWSWMGAEAVLGTMALLSYSKYSKSYDLFEYRFLEYNNAIEHDEIQEFKSEAKAVLKDEHEANDQIKLFVSGIVTVWLANMVHAYIAGPLPEILKDDYTGIDVTFNPTLKGHQLRFYIELD